MDTTITKSSRLGVLCLVICLSLACALTPGKADPQESIETKVASTLLAKNETVVASEKTKVPTLTPKPTRIPPTDAPTLEPTSTLPPITPTADKGYPPPPEEGCVYWEEVDGSYAGQTVCVYGNVLKSYTGDRSRFYIEFSPSSSAFRLILLGGYYMDLAKGQCVYKEGKILMYGKMPYMEIEDFIYLCD
jgi:hypothetical protein